MPYFKLVPAPNLLPVVVLAALIVCGFLFMTSDAPMRGKLVLAVMLIVAWMFLVNLFF